MNEPGFIEIPGAVTAPQGFLAGAINCGIKPHQLDLALVCSELPATVAVTVTTNRFRAAPTYITEEHAADGVARAIITNSGVANAGTDEHGFAAARQMAAVTGAALGIPASEVLVCSTGHIGNLPPLDKITTGVGKLVPALTPDGGPLAAQGIMTTDTFPKEIAVEFSVEGRPVRLGGICKGAGMICPNMATMLCFLTTDLDIPAELLRPALREAVDHSFNCISVDGDQSTNDTVALLANGASGVRVDSGEAPGYAPFVAALGHVTRELAKKIARDGEKCSKFVAIQVTGAECFEQARLTGRAVANYTLMRAALYGGDYNWGRLAAAVGTAGEFVDPGRTTLTMAGITPWLRGCNQDFDVEEGRRRMRETEIAIEVDLGLGAAEATVWTCDLTPAYVEYNAEYETSLFGED
ncbi:MAG TPA: bifunctional glutamate N-acetyltransferase/amino-acid acetyltransferase ArgJ [Armatimonadota bacterium]|jgi:glutamate N-acetyltransferase/amino-acid N-acetyltransferase